MGGRAPMTWNVLEDAPLNVLEDAPLFNGTEAAQ